MYSCTAYLQLADIWPVMHTQHIRQWHMRAGLVPGQISKLPGSQHANLCRQCPTCSREGEPEMTLFGPRSGLPATLMTRMLQRRSNLACEMNRCCRKSIKPTWVSQHTYAVDILRWWWRPATADGLWRRQVLQALCRCEDLRRRLRWQGRHLIWAKHGRP
jgi:hypothetical protein